VLILLVKHANTMTKQEFHDQVFRYMIEVVERGNLGHARELQDYADFFFDEHQITIKKARFAIELKDELNNRMSHV